jgi:hypothetical protein
MLNCGWQRCSNYMADSSGNQRWGGSSSKLKVSLLAPRWSFAMRRVDWLNELTQPRVEADL